MRHWEKLGDYIRMGGNRASTANEGNSKSWQTGNLLQASGVIDISTYVPQH